MLKKKELVVGMTIVNLRSKGRGKIITIHENDDQYVTVAKVRGGKEDWLIKNIEPA